MRPVKNGRQDDTQRDIKRAERETRGKNGLQRVYKSLASRRFLERETNQRFRDVKFLFHLKRERWIGILHGRERPSSAWANIYCTERYADMGMRKYRQN